MFTKRKILEQILELRARDAVLPPFNLACFVASAALIDKTDKAGAAYAHHLIRVATGKTNSEVKMIIGMLHDVVEDSDWTLDDLRAAGFDERVVRGVDGVTARPGELYFDFIVRCGQNPDSLDIKLSDLRDNESQWRNNFLLGAKDVERLNKYIIAYNYLVDVKKGLNPSTAMVTWMRHQSPRLQDWDLLRRYSKYPLPPADGRPCPPGP